MDLKVVQSSCDSGLPSAPYAYRWRLLAEQLDFVPREQDQHLATSAASTRHTHTQKGKHVGDRNGAMITTNLCMASGCQCYVCADTIRAVWWAWHCQRHLARKAHPSRGQGSSSSGSGQCTRVAQQRQRIAPAPTQQNAVDDWVGVVVSCALWEQGLSTSNLFRRAPLASQK